jgi:hypothetical protein
VRIGDVYVPDPEHYAQKMADAVSEVGREEWAEAKRHGAITRAGVTETARRVHVLVGAIGREGLLAPSP